MNSVLPEVRLKPDFALSARRIAAWWLGAVIDRPPVTFWLHQPVHLPARHYANERARWLDLEARADDLVSGLEQRIYLGDNLPVVWANLGPEITATLWGCPLEFSRDSSWSEPVVHDLAGWEKIVAMPPDFANDYWAAMERMTQMLLDRCDGRYLVGMTDLHGNYDILAALRDPQALCTDMLDAPELIRRVGRHVADGFVAAFERQYAQLAPHHMGSVSWLPCFHPGKAYIPSCDFWCMISPAMTRDLILLDVRREMEPLERAIFHLDGPTALPHLPLLLAMDNLQAVQWVYGAGQGPAARWLDVYRQIRAAGKSVLVHAADPADALRVLDALGPRGVWLALDYGFATRADAEAFLQDVARRC